MSVVCEERATYRKGTDTHTDVRRVFEQRISAMGQGTVRGFEARAAIRVPVHSGGPTLCLPNNEINWYLDVVLDGPGLPDDEQRFPFVVAPILSPHLVEELGDR